MKTFNLIKKRDQVNVKNTEKELRTIVSQVIVCGKITLRLKMEYCFISPEMVFRNILPKNIFMTA